MTSLMFFLAAICLWLAFHPFTTFPMSLWLLAKWGAYKPSYAKRSDPAALTFAICTCAYNEEQVIEAKILNLLELKSRHPGLEVMLYVDSASDQTAAICERYAGEITLHVATQRHGKTHGMNLLVGQTQADILVFTDANVILALDIVERFKEYFADVDVGCVCGNLNYINAEDSITAQSGSLYWRIEEAIKRLESVTGGVVGADGSLFAMRKSLHQPPPDHIIDDFFLSLMVMCQGRRVVQAPDVRAFEETVAVSSEEFRRKVRIACQAFNVHRLLWARIVKCDALSIYKYVSHKLLRWFAIFFLAASLLFAFVGTALAGWWMISVVLLAVPFGMWALGSRWPVRPISQIYDILSAFVGTGLGVLRSLRGERFQTWSPAASLRK